MKTSLEYQVTVKHDDFEKMSITIGLDGIDIEIMDGDKYPNSRISVSHEDFGRILKEIERFGCMSDFITKESKNV